MSGLLCKYAEAAAAVAIPMALKTADNAPTAWGHVHKLLRRNEDPGMGDGWMINRKKHKVEHVKLGLIYVGKSKGVKAVSQAVRIASKPVFGNKGSVGIRQGDAEFGIKILNKA